MKKQTVKPMTEKEAVMANVNQWRRFHRLPPVNGKESPAQFKRNFNSIAQKLEVQRDH